MPLLHKTPLFLAVATLLAPLAAAAAGQDASATTDLDAVVVTAAGYEQAIADAPASISVITGEELRSRPYTSLADAVRELEGVSVVGSDPANTDILIRGMPGEYTLLLVDGRRQGTRETMNRGTTGVQANLLPPLDAIERIEVIRGSMSALYGSDAMGGVINVITRKDPERWTGSATLDGTLNEDSDHGDGRGVSFWVGGPLSQALSLQAWGGTRHRDEDDIFYPTSYTAGSDEVDNRHFGAKLGIAFGDYQRLTLEAGHDLLEYRATAGGTLPDEPADDSLRDRHLRDHVSIAHDAQWENLSMSLALQQENARYATWNAGVRNPATPDLTNTVFDALFTLPLERNTLKFGGQYMRTRVEDIAQQDRVPGYPNVDVARRNQWALFVEDELRFSDAFRVTGGVRADHSDDFGTHVTPRLYANYRMTSNWTLRGGVAEGFKTPKLRQVTAGYCMTTGGGTQLRGPLCGNPDLEPEESRTVETGVRYDSAAMNFGATVFNTRFQNRVASYATDEVDPHNPRQVVYVYDNIDRVRIRGVELSLEQRVSADWRLKGNYTYTDSERQGGGEPAFDGGSLDGRPLDMTPEHVANLRLDWQASEALGLNLGAHYMGTQYWAGFRNGAMNVRTRPAATTFDVGASWELNSNVTFNAALLNFTDRVVPVDDRGRFDGLDGNWYVDAGRRLWASVDLRF
ncbi:MAG: TonB-dependent receptor domain-containing protein [Lysobacter sp.]